MIKEYDYLMKVVIVGDSGVGKSSLLLRFSDNQFADNYMATIGVDFRFKTLKIDGYNVKFQIWDTAGQERFRTITSAYYKGCNGIIMVFDITSAASFENLKTFWLGEVNSYADKASVLCIVGNKLDDEGNRKVQYETAESFAKQKGISIIEASAKSSDRVQEIFENIAKKVIAQKKLEPNKASSTPSSSKKIDTVKREDDKKEKGCAC